MLLHTKVVSKGDETLLLLHSGLQTGVLDYKPLLKEINNEYRAILPDLRGHGKSPSKNFDNYIEQSVEDLKESLDAIQKKIELPKVHLVGVALGALIGIQFALKYPEYLKSVTLSGIMFNTPKNYDEIHQKQVARQFALLKNEKTIQAFNKIHGPNWRKFFDISSYKSWYPFEQNLRVTDIEVPVHIVLGSKNKHEIESVDEKISSHARTTVIENGQHLVQLSQPKAYAEELKDFIRFANKK